jgi:stage II sporulation protein AA (anti-sigma F factor antagonist)
VREQPSGSRTATCDDVAAVTVTGELDLALCIKLAPELNAAMRSTVRAVVIDLEDVSLVDSSGVALLLNAFRRLDQAGRQLAIRPSPGGQRYRRRP